MKPDEEREFRSEVPHSSHRVLLTMRWADGVIAEKDDVMIIASNGLLNFGVTITDQLDDVIRHLIRLRRLRRQRLAEAERKAALPDREGWWWSKGWANCNEWAPIRVHRVTPDELTHLPSFRIGTVGPPVDDERIEWGGFIGLGPTR